MKGFYSILAALCWLTISFSGLFADNRIILYLSHAPVGARAQAEQEAASSSLAQKIAHMETKSPGTISQKMVKRSLKSNLKPKLSGLVALYGGYMDISDPDGLIAFPLRHATPKLYLAITPRITLANVKENTYSHREYVSDNDSPVALYVCELKQDEKKNSYWEIQEAKMPEDKKINPLTVVILTSPKNIFVPTGHFLTTQNPQLILPDLYVIGRSSTDDALLQSLDIRQFFEPVSAQQKKASDNALQKMISNL